MHTNHYDAIVIGARCAGSPTAMLLARMGHRVLVVDRATFPSDTTSTHMIHAPGVGALDRWGLLDAVAGSGCPAIERYSFDFGPFTITGSPGTAYSPRRHVLDTILVDAARRAGAEVREGFRVDEVLMDGDRVTGIRGRDADGTVVVERATVVIGADGWRSRVAEAVGATTYREEPKLQWSSYTYWRDLPVDGFETFIRPDRGWAAMGTNDGLTMLVVGWPMAEVAAYKADVEGNYRATLELVPAFADRVRRATRVERFGGGSVPNFFRQQHGPGWVLVGDAGYTRDSITGQGISDAFCDAERVATALDSVLRGRQTLDVAMGEQHCRRDAAVTPMFEFTTQLARLQPPPPELAQLLGAVSTSQPAMDAFTSMAAGVLSPARFFDPGHLGPLLAAAA
jgi:2-polyprenyl-6-methoxyphenol hydroxylase-like FAD-dependent oxidoreductase